MPAGFDLSGMTGSPSFQGGAGGSAATGDLTSGFNSSGWNVALGGGSVSNNSQLMIVAVLAALLIAWKLSKK